MAAGELGPEVLGLSELRRLARGARQRRDGLFSVRAKGKGERGRASGKERKGKKFWAATYMDLSGSFKNFLDLQNWPPQFVNSKSYPNFEKLFELKSLLILYKIFLN